MSSRNRRTTTEPAPSTWLDSFPLLKALLSSIGVAGVLVGCGYIAQSARDAFLGVNFPSSMTIDAYARVGGRFLTVTMSDLWLHPWISGTVLAILVTIFLIGILFRPPWDAKYNGIAQGASLLLILLVFGWKAYRLDLPYVRMVGVLTRPPVLESGETTDDLWRAHDVWQRFFCEHINGQDGKPPATLQRLFPQCKGRTLCDRPSVQALRDLFAPSKTHTCLSTEQEYVINVWLTIVLVTVTVAVVRSWSRPAGAARSASFRTQCRLGFRVLMIAVGVLGSLTLPYVFGKVVDSTAFPAGRVVFDSTDLHLKATLDTAKGLIIASDEKFVVVYRTTAPIEYQSLPRARVRYVAVDSMRDIIKAYAKSFATPPDQEGE